MKVLLRLLASISVDSANDKITGKLSHSTMMIEKEFARLFIYDIPKLYTNESMRL